MVDMHHNPRDDPAPEHTFCCGTTCDKAKVALHFDRAAKLIEAQRALIAEQEVYIKQLESHAVTSIMNSPDN